MDANRLIRRTNGMNLAECAHTVIDFTSCGNRWADSISDAGQCEIALYILAEREIYSNYFLQSLTQQKAKRAPISAASSSRDHVTVEFSLAKK